MEIENINIKNIIMENIYILVILVILYWYFNIRGLSKCIILRSTCDDISCIH